MNKTYFLEVFGLPVNSSISEQQGAFLISYLFRLKKKCSLV